MEAPCPVDGTLVPVDPRYPGLLCPACAERAVDLEGRPVALFNTSFGGGFVAHHRDDDSTCRQVTDDHRVLVDGVACRAGEARFGGVVVQAADASS